MPKRIKQWWHRWLIAADATKCHGIHALRATSTLNPSLQISTLEPRILYSASPLDPSMVADSQEVATPMPDTAEAASSAFDDVTTIAQAAPSEIVIIDPAVSDIEQLLNDLDQSTRNLEFLVLDSDQDGIEQITDLLDSKTEITSLHIVSHAENGAIKLGDLWLRDSNLNGHMESIAAWQQALHTDADILLYGCELASSQQGQSLVDRIASLTDADVSASTNDTGHATLDSDWVLEYENGSIEHVTVFSESLQESWVHQLSGYLADGFNDVFDSGDGLTTLREALTMATSDGVDTTINLLSGTYQLSIGGTGENFGLEGDLDITTNLTIRGEGIDQTIISANGIDRIFDIIGNVTVNLRDLTLEAGNSLDGDGGAIRNTTGTLNLRDVQVTNNEALNGGAIYNAGTLSLDNVIITENLAQNHGGGIYNTGSGLLTLTDVTFHANEAAMDGGGIFNAGNTSIDRSTFSNNDASNGSGGGIFNTAANGLELVNTTLSGNTANQGAALYTQGQVSITNATIVNNLGSVAIHAQPGIGSVDIKNSILVGNGVGNTNELLNSLGYNIEDGSAAFTASAGDQQNATNFLSSLGPLADNAGPTLTHALLAGSTAIDAGTADEAPTEDQRNALRDTTPDIGAYEFISSSGPVAIWKTPNSEVPNVSEWNGTDFNNPTAVNSQDEWVIIRAAESPTRDEKIVVGVDDQGNISGIMWDGSSWQSLPLGYLTTNGQTHWNFDVQYESHSGHAMLVWANDQSALHAMSYSTWNGASWSIVQNIPSAHQSYVSNLKLTASPVNDEISLVFSNANADIAIAWDGDGWYGETVLESVATDTPYNANVAHESLSGDAIVIFGDGDTSLEYTLRNTNAWTPINSIAAPATVSGVVEWTMIASDPNSDRAAAIVTTTQDEIWTTLWNGDTWTNATLLTTTAVNSNSPIASIAYEGNSGSLIAVYADAASNKIASVLVESTPGSLPTQVPAVDGIQAVSISLTPNPSTDELMLGWQDINGTIEFMSWDGTTWAAKTTVESAASAAEYQPYTFLWEAESQSVTNSDPIITSNGGNSTTEIQVAENTTFVTTVTAIDTDIPTQELLFSITGGSDSSSFAIDESTGLLTLNAAPDFEDVTDSGSNTSLVVEITVQDGHDGSDMQEITVNVTDVNEAPTDITLNPDPASVAENDNAAIIGTLGVVDPDTADTHTYSVDDNRFEVAANQLKLKSGQSLDFETEPNVNLSITAIDQAGLSTSESFTVNITDVNEAPTDITLDNKSVAENTEAAIIGTLGVVDPDTADTHAYSVDDNRFEVVGSQLKLRNDQSIDPETDPTVQINISVSDQGGVGLSLMKSFTLRVGSTDAASTNVAPFYGTMAKTSTDKPAPSDTSILTDAPLASTDSSSDNEELENSSESANTPPSPITGAPQATMKRQTSTQPTSQFLQLLTTSEARISKSIFTLSEAFVGNETYQPVEKTWMRDSDVDQRQFDGTTIDTLSRIQAIDSTLISQQGALWNQLDTQRDHIESQIHGDLIIVGTAGAAASGFTVGFIAWALRAGFLASGLLAQLPAWKAMDPTLIMQGFEGLTDRNNLDQDSETLEELMDRQSQTFTA